MFAPNDKIKIQKSTNKNLRAKLRTFKVELILRKSTILDNPFDPSLLPTNYLIFKNRKNNNFNNN